MKCEFNWFATLNHEEEKRGIIGYYLLHTVEEMKNVQN